MRPAPRRFPGVGRLLRDVDEAWRELRQPAVTAPRGESRGPLRR
jgi:hypothetical protein